MVSSLVEGAASTQSRERTNGFHRGVGGSEPTSIRVCVKYRVQFVRAEEQQTSAVSSSNKGVAELFPFRCLMPVSHHHGDSVESGRMEATPVRRKILVTAILTLLPCRRK
jgi:hypothetical protein